MPLMRKVAEFERLPEPSLDEAVTKEKRDGCQEPSRFQLPLLGSNQDSPDPEGTL